MKSMFRMSLCAVVVGGLVWTAMNLGVDPAQGTSTVDQASVVAPSGTDASLAARYHLRKRTGRFFDRAKVAARYHLRKRTDAFYDRAGSNEVAARYHLRKRTEAFYDRAGSNEVAARYHLRKRTSRFYDRAVG